MTVCSGQGGRLLLLVALIIIAPSLSLQMVSASAGRNGQPGTHKHATADSSSIPSSSPLNARHVLSRKPRSASPTPKFDDLPANLLDQATTSWSQVQFGPKKIGSIPFHSFRINVYNDTGNGSPDSHNNRYFYAPVSFLNLNDAHCTSNDHNVDSTHEVIFGLTMWNNESQLAVRHYLNNLMCKNHSNTATGNPIGCPIMEDSVEVIPFEQVKVMTKNLARASRHWYGCTVDSTWSPYQAQQVVDFTMTCPSRDACQSLASAIKGNPRRLFANHFQVALRLDPVSKGSRFRRIRVTSLLETSKLAADIDQRFTSRKTGIERALLTSDVHRDLVQGAATSIVVDTFDDSEDLVDDWTQENVVHILERFLESSVTWITGASANETTWESVFWMEGDDYRPDKTAARLNEIHEQLDAEDKQRLLEEATSNDSKLSSEISVKTVMGSIFGNSGEASYGGGSFGTENSNSSSMLTSEELGKLLAKSKESVKWDGAKFVPRDMKLVAINLARLHDTKSLTDKSVRVRYAPASVLTAPINLPQQPSGPSTGDCADAIRAAERAWSLKINATALMTTTTTHEKGGGHAGCSEGTKAPGQNRTESKLQPLRLHGLLRDWLFSTVEVPSMKMKPLPSLSFPAGLAWWKLGWIENWKKLEEGLEPVGFRKFWVTDPASEWHLAGIRDQFDRKQRSPTYNETALDVLASTYGGDNAELGGKLLALGVDPDPEKTGSWRAAHICGLWARPNLARTLSRCRPSLTAKNKNGHTPLQAARSNYPLGSGECLFPESERPKIRPEVARVWEEVEKNGFPSIAKLAYSTEWAPLQNLCRRRVISAEEAEEKYAGRTAVEWAEFYHEPDLAAELRYLLAPPTTEVAAKLATLGYNLAAQPSNS